jgi:hypothetical protein
MKQIESFELDYALEPSLHLGSPNHELFFELNVCGLNQFIFLQKWCHVGLASICHFLVLDPHLKY